MISRARLACASWLSGWLACGGSPPSPPGPSSAPAPWEALALSVQEPGGDQALTGPLSALAFDASGRLYVGSRDPARLLHTPDGDPSSPLQVLARLDEPLLALFPQGEELRGLTASGRWLREQGGAWTLSPALDQPLTLVAAAPLDAGAVAVGTSREDCPSGCGAVYWLTPDGPPQLRWRAPKEQPRAVWARDAARLQVVGAQGLSLYSDDGGKNWTRADLAGAPDLCAITGDPRGTVLYAAGDGGALFSSTDRKTWDRQETGTTEALCALAWSAPGPLYAAGDKGALLSLREGTLAHEPGRGEPLAQLWLSPGWLYARGTALYRRPLP